MWTLSCELAPSYLCNALHSISTCRLNRKSYHHNVSCTRPKSLWKTGRGRGGGGGGENPVVQCDTCIPLIVFPPWSLAFSEFLHTSYGNCRNIIFKYDDVSIFCTWPNFTDCENWRNRWWRYYCASKGKRKLKLVNVNV